MKDNMFDVQALPVLRKDNAGPWDDKPQSDEKTTTTQPNTDEGDKCVLCMTTKMCLTHNCNLTELRVSAVKWEYKPRKGCFGNVRRKVSKWICRGGNGYQKVPDKNS